MSQHILVVDDEKLIRWSLRAGFEQRGYAVTEAEDGAAARAAFASRSFDLAIVDLRLPDADGLTLLRELLQSQPDLPVILITAYSSVANAVEAMKAGAADYVIKPFDLDAVLLTARRALERHALRRSVGAEVRQKKSEFGLDKLIGESAPMRAVKAMIQKVARASSATVLLLGESGAGKDLAARAIHYESPRAEHPFMNVTCTALPETLLESELFGHEAGAFTGAAGRKKGLFELAHQGTVFLDEIGDMSPTLQAKLLRVLEDKAFRRVGGGQDIHVDVRIVAATNRDLAALAARGEFREDLYYRIGAVPIEMPPLRARSNDIPLLAAHFLARFARELRKPEAELRPDALERLVSHAWPGNVRELRNALERAVLLGESPLIAPEDLALGPAPTGAAPDGAETGALCTLAEAEARLVGLALAQSGGNLTRAGALLGISRDQVRYKAAKYGLREA